MILIDFKFNQTAVVNSKSRIYYFTNERFIGAPMTLNEEQFRHVRSPSEIAQLRIVRLIKRFERSVRSGSATLSEQSIG